MKTHVHCGLTFECKYGVTRITNNSEFCLTLLARKSKRHLLNPQFMLSPDTFLVLEYETCVHDWFFNFEDRR